MNRRVSRLGLKFLSISALAVALAFCAYLLLYELALPWFLYDQRFQPYWDQRYTAAAESFQTYVDERGLTVREALRDTAWSRGNPSILLYLDTSTSVLYDVVLPEDDGSYLIHCSDGDVHAYAYLSDAHYYGYGRAVAISAALLLFLLVVIPYFYRIIGRITKLSREMEILAGGDLSYQVLSPGKDELAQLGQGIDGMRRSVIEQIQKENEAVLANSQLITALSHDLRTPLTKLMGYLEILQYGKCGPEERADYLRKAGEKAGQMRDLSDEMFRHFQVRKSPSADTEPELVSGPALLGQMLGEQCYDLQDAGFTVEPPVPEGQYALQVRPEEVLRIFDNLFSNLKKYADPAYPVLIALSETEREVCLTLENRVASPQPTESRGIGLPTVQALLARNSGRMEAAEGDGVYRTTLWFQKME